MFPVNSQLRRIADASAEPLSLADAKAFLRIENTADDAVISGLIKAARYECENIADRSFITTTWGLTLDFLPFAGGPYVSLYAPGSRRSSGASFGRLDRDDGSIAIPRPPLIALQSLSYIDQGGATQTIDITPEGNKVVVVAGDPGRIFAAYNTWFPFSQPRPSAVQITYTAGYGPTAADVPAPFVLAISMLTAFYYETRATDAEPPRAVANLIESVAGRSYG